MYLHTAGSLYGGQKVWCMASTKEGFTLDGDDEIVNNLLFTISHTGKHANSALNTSFLWDTPGSSGMAGAVSGFSLVSTRM